MEAALTSESIVNMSIEPVAYPEAHEPNTKKKLQSAFQYTMDQESVGLAGLIMWLPGNVKGLPPGYASYDHPVVILSPSISVSNRVEILGMTSFGGRDITQRFRSSRKGMKNRAKYLPIEPTPPHPDTPEKNVMLKLLPYNPKTYSYVDGSMESRRSVLFSVLEEYLPHGSDCMYAIQSPRFYLDKDSYQKLAAFVGFSTVALLHVPVNPKVEQEHPASRGTSAEQLAVQNEPPNPHKSLPLYKADTPLPVKNQQAQSTPSHVLDPEQVSFITEHLKRQWAFDTGARHVYGPGGPLNLSLMARNSIRIAIACVAVIAAGGAFRMSTVGREVVEEITASVQAMMLAGTPEKRVATAKGALVLDRMAWAVIRHFGRNWGRYSTASLISCVLYAYDERYPGGRGFKWDQILMLAWDVACLRIVE